MTTIQVTVTDQRGVNVLSLIEVIEGGYVTPEGGRVDVTVGKGLNVDGLPQGYLRLTDRK